jgi:flagellar protein FlaG
MSTQIGSLTPVQLPSLETNTTRDTKINIQNNSVSSAQPIRVEPEYEYLDDKKRNGDTLTISEKVVYDAIERANKAVQGPDTYCKFTVHKKTNEICVKIVNSETNEVIKEIPSEKILDMVAKMCELAGIFVDEKR